MPEYSPPSRWSPPPLYLQQQYLKCLQKFANVQSARPILRLLTVTQNSEARG